MSMSLPPNSELILDVVAVDEAWSAHQALRYQCGMHWVAWALRIVRRSRRRIWRRSRGSIVRFSGRERAALQLKPYIAQGLSQRGNGRTGTPAGIPGCRRQAHRARGPLEDLSRTHPRTPPRMMYPGRLPGTPGEASGSILHATGKSRKAKLGFTGGMDFAPRRVQEVLLARKAQLYA